MLFNGWKNLEGWQKFTWVAGIIFVLVFLFYIACLNHTSVNEFGTCYNPWDGTISTQMEPGWYYTSPFVRVAYISTLPMRVTVTSNARVIVSKMVRFNPDGLDDFIRLQGFSYFFNIENTLLGYAFSGNKYSFLEIVQDVEPENSSNLLPLKKK